MIMIVGDFVHYPDAVTKEASTRAAGNVIHEIPATAGSMDSQIVVVLRPSGPRRGTKTVTFEDEYDAFVCADDLRRPRTFTYEDSDHPEHNVTFVLTAGPDVAVDEDVREPWSVSFAYLVLEDDPVGS